MMKRLLAAVLTLGLAVGIYGTAFAKTGYSDGNRIDKVSLGEQSVQAAYHAQEDAELVAAVCTSDEKEILASGRAKVPASTSGTAEIKLTGELPEYAVVKLFLLTRQEHAPLCPVYMTSGYFKEPEDIKDTDSGAFEPERILAAGESGGFAVLKHGVVLVRTGEDATGQNRLTARDDDGKVYVIEDAEEQIQALHRGQILVLELEPARYLFVRVRKAETENSTVTLYGDEGLRFGDIFDLMKLEAETSKTEKLQLEQDGLIGEAETMLREKLEVYGTAEQEFRLSFAVETSGWVTTADAVEAEIPLGELSASPVEEIIFHTEPILHLKTETAETVRWTMKQTFGFVFDSEMGEFRSTDTEPELFLTADREGAVDLTLTVEPKADLWTDAACLKIDAALSGHSEMTEQEDGHLTGTLTGEKRMEAGAVFLAERGNPYSREFLPEELPEQTIDGTKKNGTDDR